MGRREQQARRKNITTSNQSDARPRDITGARYFATPGDTAARQWQRLAAITPDPGPARRRAVASGAAGATERRMGCCRAAATVTVVRAKGRHAGRIASCIAHDRSRITGRQCETVRPTAPGDRLSVTGRMPVCSED